MRALICDVDGVLVRSMEPNYEVYRAMFLRRGVRIAPLDVYANEGRGARQLIAHVAEDHGLRAGPEELDAMAREHKDGFAAYGALPLYPGVPELLQGAAQAGWKLAAVTGNTRGTVERHLGALAKLLDAVVTGDDVAHTKPHPEPYLQALTHLGVRAQDAVVVENAVLGIRSAKAAGLRVIAVTSTMPAEALGEADACVTDIPGVARALGLAAGPAGP